MGRFILALAALAALIASPAMADRRGGGVADPRAFVAETYAAYARAPNDPPPEPVHVYSERLISLFTVYQVWARAHQDLVGSLDFDWWVNAQDWSISRVRLTQRDAGPARRIVTARWRNYDRDDSSRFVFVRAHRRWHLDDVVNGSGSGEHGWTLTALLRERP